MGVRRSPRDLRGAGPGSGDERERQRRALFLEGRTRAEGNEADGGRARGKTSSRTRAALPEEQYLCSRSQEEFASKPKVGNAEAAQVLFERNCKGKERSEKERGDAVCSRSSGVDAPIETSSRRRSAFIYLPVHPARTPGRSWRVPRRAIGWSGGLDAPWPEAVLSAASCEPVPTLQSNVSMSPAAAVFASALFDAVASFSSYPSLQGYQKRRL